MAKFVTFALAITCLAAFFATSSALATLEDGQVLPEELQNKDVEKLLETLMITMKDNPALFTSFLQDREKAEAMINAYLQASFNSRGEVKPEVLKLMMSFYKSFMPTMRHFL